MIELFAIFTKGGFGLWAFQEGAGCFVDTINAFIKDVLIQERAVTQFKYDDMTIRFKLDNEFELVFVIIYQSAIQLSYTDKLLSDVHQRFRDMYKNVLLNKQIIYQQRQETFRQFDPEFIRIRDNLLTLDIKSMGVQRKPRTFQESVKSQKTVESIIISRPGEERKSKKPEHHSKPTVMEETAVGSTDSNSDVSSTPGSPVDEIAKRREVLARKLNTKKPITKNVEGDTKKRAKQARVWELSGGRKNLTTLDYSGDTNKADVDNGDNEDLAFVSEQVGLYHLPRLVLKRKLSGSRLLAIVLSFKGKRTNLSASSLDNLHSYKDFPMMNVNAMRKAYHLKYSSKIALDVNQIVATKAGSGWFGAFKNLVGNRKISSSDIEPVLETMRENLILKNVAAEPAEKICQSVGRKLEGKVVSTFSRISSEVKEAVKESLTQVGFIHVFFLMFPSAPSFQLLTPKRRVDILRDIVEAKQEGRPYVIVFCGVNGVGKSTNLAKVTFWLNENHHRVLIVAGDTFRAGAVEQLRTHTRHLNALHPNSVQLFEQGYGKDSASLTAAAISVAIERGIDVVLVDTAGRMQDNEPLMRELAKVTYLCIIHYNTIIHASQIIRINEPDLVLFVGEALVGNEAVDQLVKFNQALADNATPGSTPRLIDGIVLTKFDTIDDKVGAAVSMTYITGQPIVFVGCGQTYPDLRNLNIGAVVSALLK
ncbi:SRP54-type protein, GTPase domain protein [Dictyocaulus viviparus]|uniref:SRP54-type protein, GTPase domain protein n=1 Tax=Dictyocaulus viviparus TaxID=29172 RepID=A0A0D8XEJ5_DICVI|nr:SRP54-type protein, GTPase domain protein [Dictyocaulus viviparus]